MSEGIIVSCNSAEPPGGVVISESDSNRRCVRS